MTDYDAIERLAEIVNDMRVGKRKAIVLSNDSTDKPGWLELQPISRDPSGATNSFWAEPCVPLAGPDDHSYWIPEVDSFVWYEHVAGHPDHHVWTGCAWKERSGLDTSDLVPSTRLLRFGDLEVAIDTEAGTLSLQSGESTSIVLSSDTIRIEASNIELVSNGNELKLSASGFDALSGALKVV